MTPVQAEELTIPGGKIVAFPILGDWITNLQALVKADGMKNTPGCRM
ncbi:MAG: hypothetical protein NVSMB42_26150 [Herpetosiphon sp.]